MYDTFKQLARFILCTILLFSAIPFIGLAAIFSLFMDIPHIKIELGADNVVESVHINMRRTKVEEKEDDESGYESEDEDEDESEEEHFIELSARLSKFIFDENSQVITTVELLKRKINRHIEEHGPADGKGKINWYPELWNFLGLDKDETLSESRMWTLLEKEYVSLAEKKSPQITGRVGGFEDNYPVTPDRPSRCESPPPAPKRKSVLDTGVLVDKLRATTDLNDGDNEIISNLSESFEQAIGAQTPSECPPSSS